MGDYIAIDFERYIRPSSIGAIALCAGRPRMEAITELRMGKAETAPVASMGNDLHERSKVAIDHVKNGTSWGDAIAAACNLAAINGIDGWSVYCLQKAIEFVRDLVATYHVEPDDILTEHTLDMRFQGFAKGGTADVILVVPYKTVIVIDFKFGFLDQGDADEHEQLSCYASAAADEFNCPEVFVFIAAPRGEKDHRFTGAKFDRAALLKNNAWVQAVIRRARAEDPELEPGYTQCAYCKAKPKCAALKEWIMQVSEAVEVIGPPTTPEAWGQLVAAAKLALEWGDDWKDKGKAHLIAQGPGSVTGWKLGNTGCITTVENVPTALKAINDAGLMGSAMEAISIKAGKLPVEVRKLIEAHIVEVPKAPSIVQEKRAKA